MASVASFKFCVKSREGHGLQPRDVFAELRSRPGHAIRAGEDDRGFIRPVPEFVARFVCADCYELTVAKGYVHH